MITHLVLYRRRALKTRGSSGPLIPEQAEDEFPLSRLFCPTSCLCDQIILSTMTRCGAYSELQRSAGLRDRQTSFVQSFHPFIVKPSLEQLPSPQPREETPKGSESSSNIFQERPQQRQIRTGGVAFIWPHDPGQE